jgi:hypothetical protein
MDQVFITPELKAQTLAHYKRMINWARTQNPATEATEMAMMRAIGETWIAEFCPICQSAVRAVRAGRHSQLDCFVCPIGSAPFHRNIGGRLGCDHTPWMQFSGADTWAEWIIIAEQEYAFIRCLPLRPRKANSTSAGIPAKEA